MSGRPDTIVRWSDPAAPRTRLLCIPHAESGGVPLSRVADAATCRRPRRLAGLFGHCSGALIAASLARALQARGASAVQHVMHLALEGDFDLGNRRPPHAPVTVIVGLARLGAVRKSSISLIASL